MVSIGAFFTALTRRFSEVVIVVIITLLVLATSWPLVAPQFFRVHDYVHAARVAEITRAMQDGQFPVRWSANFGYGYGMPLFEFYAPLPYYFGALWYWLGMDIVLVLKVLYLTCNIGTAVGAYWLGRRLGGRSAGVLVSAMITLAPYRAVNLYVRGSLSEAWAIMMAVFVLCGVLAVVRRERQSWVFLTLGLIGLMLSHNLTTMMFIPVSVILAASWWWWRARFD